jgi:ferredoxin-NADP reductase
MIAFVDRYLNHVTMYRLVLYYTAALLGLAFVLGFFGLVPGGPAQLALSTVVITAACWLVNRGLALAFRVPANSESIYITAFILALVMAPVAADDGRGLAGLVMAAGVAMASKYLLAIGRKHIFNPVAIGIAVSGFAIDQPATWWVGGNSYLLPLVLVGGLLVVRKVQRFDMVTSYIVANIAVGLAASPLSEYGRALSDALFSSPLLFAGFAMLTEPLTAPPQRLERIIFGALVGGLSSTAVHFGDYYPAPEIAFLVGNIFAYFVSPKGRMRLTLLAVEKTAAGCYDYVFRAGRRLDFAPGQYLDWTLAVRDPDARGNRRTFTIASSPAEDVVRLGVKFYPRPSAFKRALLEMKPGDVIHAAQLAGSFTLPGDPAEKLVFIAGGIGVTPFRSMIQDLLDRGEARPIVFFYGNNTINDIAYGELFERAEWELGVKTIYAVADGSAEGANVHRGFIDPDLVQREVPDYLERTFYLSGPRAMVVRFQKVLRDLGVSRARIKVDFFPGFA